MKHFFTLLFIGLSLSVAAQNTPREYIEKYKDIAVRHMDDQGVPASVILAISMHESANGNSKIAKYLNNHFGIKGKNSSKEIKSSYRGYDSVTDSYVDFMGAMHRNKKFEALFGKYPSYDYYNWVLGIENGGYAASKMWATRVLAIIKKYRLYEFDKRPGGATKVSVLVPAAAGPAVSKSSEPAINIYTVRKGDTLSAIAKKFSSSVKTLMSKNSLSNSKLSIGQKLLL
ncbi:glucosaminidase domain-containing protein [Daejeonella sp.]|uniref:glucosaminidase domain and LysM peptidoglycan-binding domain-containing protein n=1 Tax=Daejeonella sp. TaxID=2805397 RepID=UPI0030C0CEF4